MASRRALVRDLLRSPEPAIRWRTRVRVRGESPSSPEVRRLAEQIRRSEVAAALLARRTAVHRPHAFGGVYRYYQGCHWALAALADLGYPPHDPLLAPWIDRALSMWTQPRFQRTATPPSEGERVDERTGVTRLRGRYRRCASQQGYALYYAVRLGPDDPRWAVLARMLERWQWPDGGWNCDRTPSADSSSFMETLTPMRGLAAYAARTGSRPARVAADRAAEVFLSRHLFRRRSNGKVMRPSFLRLHYPLYWHYDVLGGLKGMVEAGRIADPRCGPALDWLEDHELPRGGWAADERYGHYSAHYESGADSADWGAPDPGRRNDWVTTDALQVLAAAGRLAG